MFKLNPFRQPRSRSAMKSWAHQCDDAAKIALFAAPAMFVSENALLYKVISGIGLLIVSYVFLLIGEHLHQLNDQDMEK